VGALIHRNRELAVASGRPIDGGADRGNRLIAAECLVAQHVNQPPKIDLYQRIRVKLRQSPADLGQPGLRAQRPPSPGPFASRQRSGSGNTDTGS
jgi:hypothetical protein